MQASVVDYRTASGASRRQEAESVLGKYLRVARVEAKHLSLSYPLPIARPEVTCALSFSDYDLLIEVLDELFILEAAARYADRKAGDIARRRLYAAISDAVSYTPDQIERLLTHVDRSGLSVLRAVARAILPQKDIGQPELCLDCSGTATVIQFPKG